MGPDPFCNNLFMNFKVATAPQFPTDYYEKNEILPLLKFLWSNRLKIIICLALHQTPVE